MTSAAIESPAAGVGARPRTVLTIATMAAAIDGFDGQAMAFVAPGLSRAWGVGLPAFGAIFSLGLTGLIVGGMVLAPMGDRWGRKRLIVGSGLGIALFTFATAFATTIGQLVVARFLTGICLGAMMPGLVSLAHEAPADRQRTMYVTILMSGFPMGGFVGGMLAAWLLPIYGWQALFVALAIVALVVVTALAAILDPVTAPRPRVAERQGLPVVELFRGERMVITLILWLLFFATLLNVYLLASWLPALLEREGFTGPQAASAAGLLNLGGALGGLGLGFLVARYGARVLVAAFLVGAIGVVALGFVAGAFVPMLAVAFVVGIMIPGGHVSNNAIAAASYPTTLRSTGIGWAQSIGRIGSVLGPALVGLALANQLSNRQIFACAAVLAVVGASAALMLYRRMRRSKDDLL